jgi:hypothetical protein
MLMPRNAIAIWVFCVALIPAQPVFGQNKCTVMDSIESCWQKYNVDPFASINTAQFNAARAEKQAKAQRDTVNGLLELVTSSGLIGGDTASTVTNFLPLMSFTGFGGSISGDNSTSSSSDEDLAFDLNLPFFGSDGENAIKLQAIFARKRELYAPLLNATPEADRDQIRREFDDQSDIGDDVRIALSYNLTNKTFGRTFRQHRDDFDALFSAATNSIQPGNIAAMFAGMQQAVTAALGAGATPPGTNVIMNDWLTGSAFSPGQIAQARENLIAKAEQAARATANFDAAIDASLAANHVLEFRKLVDNQPQLTFSFTARERDDLVGPDEQMASLAFEFPLGANLWGFSRKYGSSDCKNGWDSQDCLRRYREYIENQSQISKLAPRLSVSVDWSRIDDYSVNLSDPIVSYSQEGSDKIVASLGFGMRFDGEGATRDTRFDMAFKYEDLSDDPTRNSRSVGSATWTKQFRGLSIPVTLVYSNKPEFLDQQATGERLSANIGIKYELRQYE